MQEGEKERERGKNKKKNERGKRKERMKGIFRKTLCFK